MRDPDEPRQLGRSIALRWTFSLAIIAVFWFVLPLWTHFATRDAMHARESEQSSLQGIIESRDDREIRPSEFPYESISLERGTPCWGPCPDEVVTVYSDGTATLVLNNSSPEKRQTLTGKIDPRVFARFCQMADAAKRASRQERYTAPWKDTHTSTLTVRSNRGGVWRVKDYGKVGPPEVWALEQLLFTLQIQMHWNPPYERR